MSTLYEAMPSLVPRPQSYGRCKSSTGQYFFLNEFKQMKLHTSPSDLPDPRQLGQRIARLHLSTKGKSPSGNFGCDPTTVPYDGQKALLGGWEPTWAAYFTRLLQLSYSYAERLQPSQNLDTIQHRVVTELIPRLLGPLEKGAGIQPCLIHGDLWESNIGTDEETRNICIFDAAAYWAHNKKELGIWMCAHHAMHTRFDEFAREYWRAYLGGAGEGPDGEWRDRVRLYSTQTMLMACGDAENGEIWEGVRRIWEGLVDRYASVGDGRG